MMLTLGQLCYDNTRYLLMSSSVAKSSLISLHPWGYFISLDELAMLDVCFGIINCLTTAKRHLVKELLFQSNKSGSPKWETSKEWLWVFNKCYKVIGSRLPPWPITIIQFYIKEVLTQMAALQVTLLWSRCIISAWLLIDN